MFLGNVAGNIKISSLYNFVRDDEENVFYADSFTLHIPFAGQALSWEIMFSHTDLLMPPDTIFDDETFCNGPNLLNTLKINVPSISRWDPYDSTSLITMIQEFLLFYKKHNVIMNLYL